MNRLVILLLIVTAGYGASGQCRTAADPRTGKPMLVGKCSRKSLEKGVFREWFEKGYREYRVDSASIDRLAGQWKDIDIRVVLATWCSDSRREVPAFYRILDYAGFKKRHLDVICVDRSKQAGKEDISALAIRYVPTMIIYCRGAEIGRIIESPEETLEKDLLRIIGQGNQEDQLPSPGNTR